MQQLLKALTHALQLKIDGICLQAWLGCQHAHNRKVNQTSQEPYQSEQLWLLGGREAHSHLVATCTLAVAGRARGVAGQREIRRRDEIQQQGDTRRKESFTNLMKKCVDEVPGNGTFIAPGAPCAVLAVGLGLGLGFDSCCIDGSDLGAEVVLLSVC